MKQAKDTPAITKTMGRYFALNRKHLGVLALTIAASLLSAGISGYLNITLSTIVDSLSLSDPLPWRQILLLGMLALGAFPAQYVQQYMGTRFSFLCDRSMRRTTYETILRMEPRALDGMRTGDILTRANGDLNQVNGSLQNYFAVFLPQQIIGLVCLGVSLYLSWQLTLVSLAAIPVFGFIQVKLATPIARFTTKRQAAVGRSLSIAQSLMGGYETAKAYAVGDTITHRYDAAMDEATQSGTAQNKATILMTPLSQIMYFLPQIVICGFGVFLASQGRITPGNTLAVLTLSVFIRNPILDFSRVLSNFQTASACAGRLFSLWDMPLERQGEGTMEPLSGGVTLQGVEFAYLGKAPVLKGVSLQVQPQERVALVGASGGGKSTVIKLIMGLYAPLAGSLSVLGRPIAQWPLDALRANISYVGQDAYLFPGSIRENVALGRPEATPEEITRALRAALLDDLDVDRELGERGVRLSGGQRQRVCIARAMLKDAPLVVLDEPTSALDTQSEAQVSQALETLMQGRTAIIIAHRLSALRGIDRIICLEDGVVAEQGTHDALMAKQGVYYALYHSQQEETHA